MAVIDFTSASNNAASNQTAARSTNSRRRNDEELTAANLWFNVGYELKDGTFIAFQSGIAIDNMRDADVRGQNEEWVKTQKARNKLRDDMIRIGSTLQPGEEKVIFKAELGPITWVGKLRRINNELQIDNANNEFALNIADMYIAAPAVTPAE